MRIFVLLSRVPWPLEKGDKLRAWHQIEELSKHHDIYLFCLSDQPVSQESVKQLEKICKDVHIFRLNKLIIFWKLFLGLFGRLPFQVNYFYQHAAQKKINQLLKKIQPDHIYCQLIRTTEYVKNIHAIPKTLDYMDAFSKGMERRISKVPFYFRPVVKIETRRLVAYENLIFDYFETKTIITEQDRNFIFHPDQKKIAIIPNGVDFDYFHPLQGEKKYSLIFHGNMSYAPNVDTAIYLAKEILPELRKQATDINLLLSGANPHPRVSELAKLPGITVTGWVDDPRKAYAAAKIFIAPLQIGTGLQNKLLEAMAMKIPCITSPLANNALKAIPEKEVIIASSTSEYVEAVLKILKNPDDYVQMTENAYQMVTERFNWNASVQELERLMLG